MGLVYKILLLFAALVLLAVAGVCGWFFVYTGDLPDIKYLSQFAPVAQSLVSDSCLASPSTVIPFDRIGKPLQDALAAAEPHVSLSDQIARSLMCNRHERAGRYTLNTVRLSWHIRRRFSEQQLFTIYANRAYFGPGATGVEGASRQFFHKAPDTLSTEEAALIAGLLRAPNLLSPYKSPERALERRNKVLEGMVAQGRLSSDEAAKAEAAPLGVLPDLALISLLTTAVRADDLATSFKQAVALAAAQDKERAARAYGLLDLKPYYEQKYSPVFLSCLKSTDHPDTSPFSFVVAIGKDGRVLRLYIDHETNIFACVRQTLQQDEFPHPPLSPYYMHVSMSFSK